MLPGTIRVFSFFAFEKTVRRLCRAPTDFTECARSRAAYTQLKTTTTVTMNNNSYNNNDNNHWTFLLLVSFTLIHSILYCIKFNQSRFLSRLKKHYAGKGVVRRRVLRTVNNRIIPTVYAANKLNKTTITILWVCVQNIINVVSWTHYYILFITIARNRYR